MPEPRIALWGTFDVDNYGDHLFPRVAVPELGRRGVAVDVYAPYGWLHPTRLDGPHPVAPLGPWTEERARRFAAAYDAVVVGGGEIVHLSDRLLAPVYGVAGEEIDRLAPSRYFVEGLGADLEATCPVVWHAVGVTADGDGEAGGRLRAALGHRRYVAVRDRPSRERLRRAGVSGPVDVVPDSALLLDRVLPRPALEERLERLRRAGGYPPSPPLVLQGCDLLVPHAEAVAAALRRWLDDAGAEPPLLLADTGRCRGDGDFAAALAARLAPRRTWRLPPGAGVEDIAAALAGGAAFVGSSLHGAITALVHGRPFLLLNLAGESKLDGFADATGLPERVLHGVDGFGPALDRVLDAPGTDGLLARLQAGVDRHFDRVAGVAAGAAARRRRPPDGDGAARPRPDGFDREAVAAHLGLLRARLDELGGALHEARREASAAGADLAALRATRTFRSTAGARRLYGHLRARAAGRRR